MIPRARSWRCRLGFHRWRVTQALFAAGYIRRCERCGKMQAVYA